MEIWNWSSQTRCSCGNNEFIKKILRSDEVARQCAVHCLASHMMALSKVGAVSALMWLSKEGMELDEDEEEWEDNYLPSSKTKPSGSNYQNGRPSRKPEDSIDGLKKTLRRYGDGAYSSSLA